MTWQGRSRSLASVLRPRLLVHRCFLSSRLTCSTSVTSSLSSSSLSGLRVCVVGSGPAGFYTVEHLLGLGESRIREIALVERFPVPFGLVRYGVAPDHPEVKLVMNKFSQLASDARVRFVGNVALGRDVSLDELRHSFDAVFLAYGASSDRNLGISGENLKNVAGARSFVEWYNGFPNVQFDGTQATDFARILSDSFCSSIFIIGQGNVAIDVARILATPVPLLRSTDISSRALQVLSNKHVKHIGLMGRRGPLQSAFTLAELRELSKLDGARVVVRKSDLEKGLRFEEDREMFLDRVGRSETRLQKRSKDRLVQLLSSVAVEDSSMDNIRSSCVSEGIVLIELLYFCKPIRLEGDMECEGTSWDRSAKVQQIVVEETQLQMDPTREDGSVVAVGTGKLITFPAQMVLTSIGYRSTPVDGLPFDVRRGVAIHRNGVVQCEDGLFVSGWLKRGPSGVIGTNRDDAEETVSHFVASRQDREDSSRWISKKGGVEELFSLLAEKNIQVCSWDGACALMDEEKRRGQQTGKIAEKMLSSSEMLSFLST